MNNKSRKISFLAAVVVGIVSTGKVLKIANGGTNTVSAELYIGGAK